MSDQARANGHGAICPHGDPTCPCPDGDACHYEGFDAMICPNPPFGFKGVTWAHCHMEGCTWHQTTQERDVRGECGLVVKLKLAPIDNTEGEPTYSMTQARPGLPGWPCGWLRTPLNISNREDAVR